MADGYSNKREVRRLSRNKITRSISSHANCNFFVRDVPFIRPKEVKMSVKQGRSLTKKSWTGNIIVFYEKDGYSFKLVMNKKLNRIVTVMDRKKKNKIQQKK